MCTIIIISTRLCVYAWPAALPVRSRVCGPQTGTQCLAPLLGLSRLPPALSQTIHSGGGSEHVLGLECPPLYNTVPRLEDGHHHLVVKIKNNHLILHACNADSLSFSLGLDEQNDWCKNSNRMQTSIT